MDQQLAQKWCSDCHAVGAEDAEAYGFVPNFVLIAEMCFSIGGLNWYSRRSKVPGLRRGKQELASGDSDSVNLGSNPGPPATQWGLRDIIFRCVRIRDIPAG